MLVGPCGPRLVGGPLGSPDGLTGPLVGADGKGPGLLAGGPVVGGVGGKEADEVEGKEVGGSSGDTGGADNPPTKKIICRLQNIIFLYLSFIES